LANVPTQEQLLEALADLYETTLAWYLNEYGKRLYGDVSEELIRVSLLGAYRALKRAGASPTEGS
jgi:hypothetical protein